MRSGSLSCVVSVLVVLTAASLASAEPPDYELVQITDPTELAERGLGLDATIYKVVRLGAQHDAGEQPEFGVDRADYSPMMSTAFMAANSLGSWATSATDTGIFCQNTGSYMWYDAQILAPTGAALQGVRTWVWDSHVTENVQMWVWEHCQPPYAAGTPSTTELLDLQVSNGSAGNYSGYSDIAPDRRINNLDCVLRVRVRLGDSDGDCNGSSIRLQKARAQWKRQISPAPGTATFNDVPTHHIFFQHIEALVDSGITAGCGGGSFCPNATLSRGEMAVFLAKGLGLHWDNGNL